MVKNRTGPGELYPGSCIGRYRIGRELGRGGESVVYLATDLRLGKQWAVKVIQKKRTSGGSTDPGGRSPVYERILPEEAELMKRLDHPALPRIVDILEQDGLLILIMDYIEGETLASLLKRNGPFEEDTVRGWMFCLASVLAYLHEQSPPVIYRDMKPANVMRKPDGSLVLLDLGIAREYKTERGQDTSVLGTKGYAPPEQYGNAQTDIRSDIYSLGMTAAELLTGCPPDRDPYLYKPHPFRQLVPGISREFEKILNRCLAFSPRDRYSSCHALMRDLGGEGTKKRIMRTERAGTHVHRGKKIQTFGRNRKTGRGRTKYRQKQARRQSRGRRKPDLKEHGTGKQKTRKVILLTALILTAGAGILTGIAGKQPGHWTMAVRSEEPEEKQQGKTKEGKEENEDEKPDRLQEIRRFLNDCGRKGELSEEESGVLQRMLGELTQEEYRDPDIRSGLCFAVGRTYLMFYSGDGGSFRSRVLRAQPYFTEALTSLEEGGEVTEGDRYKETADAGTENSGDTVLKDRIREYVQLCDIFSAYLFDRDGTEEPDGEECEKVVDVLRRYLQEPELYGEYTSSAGDCTLPQLGICQNIAAFLSEYRQNFAEAEIPQEVTLDLLEKLEEKAETVCGEGDREKALCEEIREQCAACRNELTRTYAAIKKWKEARSVYEETAADRE